MGTSNSRVKSKQTSNNIYQENQENRI